MSTQDSESTPYGGVAKDDSTYSAEVVHGRSAGKGDSKGDDDGDKTVAQGEGRGGEDSRRVEGTRPAVDRWRRERREGRVRGGEGATAEESGEEDEGRSEGEGGEGGGDTEGKGGQKGRILTRAPIGLRLRWMIEGKGPPWAQR